MKSVNKNKLTDAQKLDILIPKGMALLSDCVRQKMPETGRFQRILVIFDYPGTGYQALLWVEHNVSEQGGNGRLTAGMREAGCDKVVQHYIAKGTKEDLIQWLSTPDNGEELRSSYAQLKNSVDRFD